ncbi:MAG: hypothetical protein RIR70_63, partial [Pseudomonadota bacterium]
MGSQALLEAALCTRALKDFAISPKAARSAPMPSPVLA